MKESAYYADYSIRVHGLKISRFIASDQALIKKANDYNNLLILTCSCQSIHLREVVHIGNWLVLSLSAY